MESFGSTLLRAAQAGPAASLRSAVTGSGLRLSADVAHDFQHRAASGRPRPRDRARALPRHSRRGRRSGVLGVPEGLARAASSPGRHRRSRECDRARQRQRAHRALRLALPHGRRHQSRRHRHLRHAPAPRDRRVPRRFLHPPRPGPAAARPPSSAGPPRAPGDTAIREIDTMDLTHDAMLVSLRISAWSGRLYDRKASNHVAVHHDASPAPGATTSACCPRPPSRR